MISIYIYQNSAPRDNAPGSFTPNSAKKKKKDGTRINYNPKPMNLKPPSLRLFPRTPEPQQRPRGNM